ncbi:MAG: SDR family NAD(P)-dependent oxidoreductase [Rubrivivax sp.]
MAAGVAWSSCVRAAEEPFIPRDRPVGTPVLKLFDLTGRTALVTGGSRGGWACGSLRRWARPARKILLTSRKGRRPGKEPPPTCRPRATSSTHWVAADASDPAQVHKVVDETMQRLGRIDILVNNAGATWGAAGRRTTRSKPGTGDEPERAQRDLPLFSQAVGRDQRRIPRSFGRIINVASIAGLGGSAEMKFIAYGTSKGAVVSFTHAGRRMGGRGITVNALCTRLLPEQDDQGHAAGLRRQGSAAAPLHHVSTTAAT